MKTSLRADRSNLTKKGRWLRSFHSLAMTQSIVLFSAYFFLFTLSSCSLLGLHVKVQNPKHANKYPKFSESTKLLGNENTKYRNCFDVTYYNLFVMVNEENKSLKGAVEIYATTLSDFDTLQIDLYENMKIISIISEEGKELSYTRKHGAIFVAIKEKANAKFSLAVDYEGSPLVAAKPPWKGGFVWSKDKEKNPWIGVACETEGASLWWPCKDVNNDEPDSVTINITVKKDLVAVCNGHLIGKTSNGMFDTYRWFVSYPINLYDVTLYVGKFKLLADSLEMPSGKTLSINHYVLPINYEKAKTHLAQAKDFLVFYEKTFGEYPWYKDGYKLVESPYEGMEHQSAIAYGAGYKNSYNGFDYIILHESAHEWWGNSVSASDFSDVWLQEGFATYAEALYVESTEGKNAYLNYLLVYRLFIANKYPVVGPAGYRYFDYRNSDCYQKGAWVLHTFRTQISDDKIFFDILKSFQEKYAKKTVTSQNFIDMVNEKTGEDYEWFFKQYLYERKTPILEYYWDGTDFYYHWKNVDPTFKMSAELMLDNLVKVNLKPTVKVQKIAVSSLTYKEISFNNYTKLFGIEKNKRLRKISPTP
ncbi:MAG: M1 family metallopeptidase [Bacteroidetes bacterium]|nr:M1 family metallopeptidase [Bacteroidota bacterium]